MKYAIMSLEEKKRKAKEAIKYFSRLADSYRKGGFKNDADRCEAEKQEYIKDFPELA